MERRVCLIVNPSAGGGRSDRAVPAVEDELRKLGLSARTERTRDLDHARELAVSAATNGEIAVALGGDGLLGAVADALRAHPAAELGLLPGGRGNDLARVLGIPRDPLAACAVIAHGVSQTIDLGEVDGHSFIGIASAGFDSDANRIANDAPSRLGSLVYAYGALRALAAWRPAQLYVELDPPAAPLEFTAYSVVAANSSTYGGGMRVAPGARLDDGLLEVVVIGHVARARFLANLPRVFRGSHVHLPTVHVFRAREVRLDADRPFELYADGDPIAPLPAVVRALPGAVRMLVPAGGAISAVPVAAPASVHAAAASAEPGA